MKALVLLSGGLHSMVALQWALEEFKDPAQVKCISFDFNNEGDANNSMDLKHAEAITENYGVDHIIIDFASKDITGSPQLMLMLAHEYAVRLGAKYLITGTSEVVNLGTKFNRKMIDYIQTVCNTISGTNIAIVTPLMRHNKAQIYGQSHTFNELMATVQLARICDKGSTNVNPWGFGCGKCAGCMSAQLGFKQAVAERYVPDPNPPQKPKPVKGGAKKKKRATKPKK